MRIPDSLATLFDYGVIEDVVRPLMSGKEAQVYLVVSGGKHAVAKIYKEAHNRTFKHRAEYTEGRKVRNTRDQRAIDKRSKHGRQQDEAAWRSTEVDMIHRLHAAGVRVPVPHHFIDGVLVMELITDAEGNPAPRLGDLAFDRDQALAMYERLIREVVRMLCAGVVHGDLSEFNVLVGADGPVIIDFPQSVDSAQNMGAKKLLLRDVDNLHRFLTRLVPNARRPPYAQEMWHLYEQNLLTPDTRLRGDYRPPERRVNTDSVLELIDDAARDERKRRDSLGLRGGPPHAQPARGGPPQTQPNRGNAGRGGAPQGRGGRPGDPASGRGPQPRKDPPVYQGLPNEGLKAFRYLLDDRGPPKRGQGQQGHPGQRHHGQQGQRPPGPAAQPPRHQGQQGQRPPGPAAQPHPHRGQSPTPPHRGHPNDARAPRPQRPEVERIHVRPRNDDTKEGRSAPTPVDPAPRERPRQEPARRPQPSHGPAPEGSQGEPRRRRVIRSGATPDRSTSADRSKATADRPKD